MPTVTMEVDGKQEVIGDEWQEGQVVIDEPSEEYEQDSRSPLPASRVREGETRRQTWERLRREARTSGMTRRDAVAYAGREVERLLGPEPVKLPPEPEPEPEEAPPEPEPVEVQPEPVAEIPEPPGGLGALPEHWPKLPANATLTAEIAWVLSSRLDVVTETPAGSVVDLSRAEQPPPSKAALAWLETAITFPAKFADVAVKATQNQDDDSASTRREKVAVDEVGMLLGVMVDDVVT